MARSLAVTIAALAVVGTAAPSAAHPPAGPDHGLDPETFHTLWSGDEDDADAEELDELPPDAALEVRTLAATTDIPLDTPPQAVERWNRGDHRDFPTTDRTRSIHPPDATLHHGRFVRDAYAAVFAVQPSTRAMVTPADQPLYVAPSGELLGTVDYRVAVPPRSITPNRTVDWRLVDHDIAETRLLVDGRVESTGSGSHTTRLPYTLDEPYWRSRTLTLEADIEVRLRQRIRTCGAHDNESDCIGWNTSSRHRTETVTVRESIAVEPYVLAVDGLQARYPDGARELLLFRNRPWLGYTLPGGEVRGVWRFYSARDERWDSLVVETADGRSTRHSPMHPLQIHAYPFEPGPTASPRDTVTIVRSFGSEREPPDLPSDVHLDVIPGPYTASFGLVTRTTAMAPDRTRVTAFGLVRGERVVVDEADLKSVPVHESELTLSIVEATPETVTVRVDLVDTTTGEPINTLGRDGAVIIQGELFDTDHRGTVTHTIDRPSGAITARFEPGDWWLDPVGYVSDSDVVYVRGTVLHALAIMYQVGVPVALFLLGVYFIDRITGWRVWPPWRSW